MYIKVGKGNLIVVWKICFISVCLILFLVGCKAQHPARVTAVSSIREVTPVHEVKKGETLYSIAWKRKIDFRDIAKINYIEPPYTIKVGQRLRLKADANKKADKKVAATSSQQIHIKPVPVPAPVKASATATKQSWAWPVAGKVVSKFNNNSYKANGIDICNSEGTLILAAQNGEVVYSGDALRGYGNLIIIKHDKNFLSAYAHNRKNIVKEGDTVKIGQRIAEMGRTGSDIVKLHFEVRYKGRPIDPEEVLPRK